MSGLNSKNEWGGFINGMINIEAAFRIDGANDPDLVLDGNTNVIDNVNRDSAGIFTVTLASWIPEGHLPDVIIRCPAECTASDAAPVKTMVAQYVLGSWSKANRTFQIATVKVGDTAASAYFDAAPDDPDDNTFVSFCVRGSLNPAGQDLVSRVATGV